MGAGANVAQVGFFGYVEVYSGASGHRLARITSPVAFNGFGWSLAFVGDLNGDGRDELSIGAPFEPNGSMPYAGAMYLVSGLTTPACAVGGVGLPAAGPEAVLTLNGSPAPWAIGVPSGLPFPRFITFQGVVEHVPGAPPNNLAITNAVILDVQ